MEIVNEYKIKSGITAEDIKKELKEKHMPVIDGCVYVNENAVFRTYFTVAKEITADVGFPQDLSEWDSFDYITIIDESFAQPYYPFYHADTENGRRFPYVMNVIGHYNKIMNSFSFLERLEGEELESMKKRHEVE